MVAWVKRRVVFRKRDQFITLIIFRCIYIYLYGMKNYTVDYIRIL